MTSAPRLLEKSNEEWKQCWTWEDLRGAWGGGVARGGRSLLLELRFQGLLSVALATFQAELEHFIPVFSQDFSFTLLGELA